MKSPDLVELFLVAQEPLRLVGIVVVVVRGQGGDGGHLGRQRAAYTGHHVVLQAHRPHLVALLVTPQLVRGDEIHEVLSQRRSRMGKASRSEERRVGKEW